jgi:two-component system chemotaxis response regulator CheB
MIRVLVIDDSATARALLGALLRADPAVEVVGEAADGQEGVDKVQRLRPDVVTMDVHMPRLDGLAATKEIMITAPTPVVLVTGSSAPAEVGTAMNALRAGAVAVLHKPGGPGTPDFEARSRELLDTVKAMAGIKLVRHWRPGAVGSQAPRARPAGRPAHPPLLGPASRRARVVALAASTGGPEALQRLLGALPGDFPVPLVAVQHITPGFTRGLAEWLGGACDLRVKLAEQGEVLAGRTAYLAPDDRHLAVSPGGTVVLSDGPPVRGFRPSATFLFESVAGVYGPAATAVILTGMGDDGVAGLRAVRQAGGRVLAQDEKSCVVFGMPGAAVAAGLADLVLSPEGIASQLAGAGGNSP